MFSQRVCQIFPIPTDRAARQQLAQDLQVDDEGVLCCMKRPTQGIFAGMPSTNASEVVQNISSSLTTTFWVGSVASAEAAIEQWARDCFAALNSGLCPEDDDGAFLGLWQHPAKDLALVGVLCSGDWAADLDGALTEQAADLTQVAYAGNDNEPVGFLPDFVADHPELDGQRVYDIVETVLLANGAEWMEDTFEALDEIEAHDLVARYKAAYG